MDIQEQFTVSQAEKDQYLKIIDNLNASMNALDTMYRESIQSNHKSKTDLLLLNNELQKLKSENAVMKKDLEDVKVELENVKSERDNFKSIVDKLSSDSQSIEG
jgi:chromosome segregation ATPase